MTGVAAGNATIAYTFSTGCAANTGVTVYVRFASVYRRFEDVHAFRIEIEKLERDMPQMEGLQLPLLEEPQQLQKPARAKR